MIGVRREMLSDAAVQNIDEMITIADELGAIVPKSGWTKYALKNLEKLQELSAEFTDARMDSDEDDLWEDPDDLFPEEDDEFDEDEPKGLSVDDFQKMIDDARNLIHTRQERARLKKELEEM